MKRTTLFSAFTLVAALAVAPMAGWAKTSELPRSMELQTAKGAAAPLNGFRRRYATNW